ncbi:hypothetical protein [Actinacidiphila soli]|jgi:hypothetical protein|uniref:hypothetical protein n=1 Tax=Actinacidiphila soli TaxID=2487275 RepID=UPI000FCCD57D|nr:hypothetical protein [Actinacidiphila soli]
MLRGIWLCGTVVLTLGCYLASIALAPAGSAQPVPALGGLLFLGTSVHVAATAWFWSVPEVRGHMLARRGRYVLAPVALVVGTALLAAAASPRAFVWVLPVFLAWQFFHFQKQNLGLAALSATAYGDGRLDRAERAAVTAAGVAGIVALLSRPELLQLTVDLRLRFLFPPAAIAYSAAVGAGCVLLLRRRRPGGAFVAVYVMSLLFFLPVFVFASPYAAVAGLTAAHGYQYLLIMALVAGGGRPGLARLVSLALLLNIGLLLGTLLNLASHLHGSSAAGRALYGAYLGAVMAHFVIDAGLWRLRDEFPRRFLTRRLPYLLGAGRPSAAAAAADRVH